MIIFGSFNKVLSVKVENLQRLPNGGITPTF
jgi:hypothetical protein